MKTSLYLLSIICLLCFCCQEQKSSNSGRQQYKIEPTEIEPLPYYVNRTGDTIDVSLPMKSNAILDTNYRLPLKAKPLTLEKVTAFPNHVTRASEPIVIPFEESMWDTLVHGDTLRIATRPLKGRGIEVERSFIKRAGAPTIKGQPDYAITSLGADQGLSNTFHRKFAKDDKGNIWFLSYIGLTRYDGVTMENYDLPGKGITSFMSMLCDSDQNIWVAGREKMIRYNGTQFEVYDDFPSSEEALFISDLAEDHENNIWFLGGDNGFGYIKDSIIYSFPDLTGKVGQAGKFFSDSSENMWMMISRNRQLIKYDGTHFVSLKSSIPTATERSFSSLTADDEGNIWMLGSIGQQATLVKFDGNNFYVYSKEQGFDGKVSRSIFDNIEITSEGLVLVTSAGKGLTEFDGVYFTKISTDQGLSGNLSDLLEDDAGNIWITSGDYENLFTYHPKRFKHLAYDKMDSIGLGGTGYLMNKFGATWWYNRDNKAFLCLDKNSVYHYQTDVSFAYLFFEDQRGGIWSNSTGESAFHLYKDSIAEIKIDAYIPSILDISDQEIWFATVANLVQLDKTGKTTLDYDVDFLGNGERFFNIGIAKDSKRQLWGATMNGKIANYSEDRFTYYNFPVKKNSTFIVTNPIVDDADNVWFIYGTQALIKYDGERFWQYDFSDQMKGEIQSFLLDDVGNIWITSLGDGVIRFDGKQIQFLTTKDGLLENNTSIINKDFEGRIWVVSVAGMNIIERHQLEDGKEQFHIYTYGKTDGLYANFFPIVVGSNFSEEQNTAFIRGMTASSYFDPDQLKIPAPPKNLSLAQLDINQELIDYSRLQDSSYRATLTYGEQINQSFSKSTRFTNYPLDLTLPHYLDHLAFHFTAINWEAPHKIRYSFKMKGLESDWSTPQTEPIIDYRNLPHGQYTLMARVKNESNVWSEPFEYQFTIRPPWWLSPIAYIVYVLAFLLFLYSLFLYLRRRLQLENAYKQEQAEAQRLKELDTFKSRLYTNLTHEFRTPLTIILGMVEQMRTAPKKYFDEGTQMIERNGRNLLRLINQLLDLSKLENKSFQLQLQQGDIINYLRYLTESFQTYVNSHNLSIRFSSTLEEQWMDYDPEQIKQILTNLVSNAVKFTPSGGHIKVKLAKEKESLILKIEDTGIGIAAEKLPHIFDRFYQVDDSSTRTGEGTGIGLAHTQELVRLMNGQIKVESQLDRGTTFIIRLPITQNSPKIDGVMTLTTAINLPDSSKIEQSAPLTPITNEGERPHLLIIEDNHDVVAYLKTCLEDQYQLDIAFNGAIGIEKALENIPDLIISDVMMPEKNGYEVCDTLKNDERTSHIPITLLTAKADGASKIKGLKRGADAYLSKPFNKEELLVRLSMMLERQRKLAAYFSQKVQSETSKTASIIEQETDFLIEDAFLKKVTKIIEKNYQDEAFGLAQLCQKIGMSRSQLFRKMKALIDRSPSQFIRSFRLKKAKQLLESGAYNVNEATWETGFSNPTHFSKIFKEEFKISPSELYK